MLEYIKGKLTDASPLKAVVETGGLGYALLIPLSNYAKLPPIGGEILFYLSPVIREDAHKLYGFLTRNERDLFEKLTEVSGIGPKTGLALIGHLDLADLQFAISQADVTLLSKVPGIGKKTAERLVVEMRDKVKFLDLKSSGPGGSQMGGSRVASDAISALIHLGYNAIQAQKAIKTVLDSSKEEPALAQLITAALRAL